MALKQILILTQESEVTQIQIFVNSKHVINA